MSPLLLSQLGLEIYTTLDRHLHKKPHIHVRYCEFRASIDIETAEILDGEIPQRQLEISTGLD